MEPDRTADITKEFTETIEDFQDWFKIFLKKYRNQCITDYLTEQHENANHVYTQTDPNPVTEEEIKNPLLVVAREEKLVRVKMGLFERNVAENQEFTGKLLPY